MVSMTEQSTPRGKADRLPGAQNASRSLLYISLAVNALFVIAIAGFFVLAHTKNFWVAKIAHETFQRTCPDKVADKTETKNKGDIAVSTYYVSTKALDSGCADAMMQSATVDDFRAYPDHAKESADTLRELAADKRLQVTVVKSLENGQQLAPLLLKKQ